jgi:hypothetical protein
LVQALDDLTVNTQKLLKEEWEKVKDEAERGNLKTQGPRSWHHFWRKVPRSDKTRPTGHGR